MEEIRKELEGIDIFLRKDIEIITEHVQVLNSSRTSIQEKEHALDELEYYVHQIDNARDLHSIGGLSLVIKLMNSSEESLRARACFVLGSATQRWASLSNDNDNGNDDDSDSDNDNRDTRLKAVNWSRGCKKVPMLKAQLCLLVPLQTEK